MSAKLAATVPHALNRAVIVFAWLWVPLLAGTVAAAASGLPERWVTLLTGAAVASTGCVLRLCQERRTDARVAQMAGCHEQCETQMALLAATMMNSGLLKVAPIPQPSPAPDRLHLVEGAS